MSSTQLDPHMTVKEWKILVLKYKKWNLISKSARIKTKIIKALKFDKNQGENEESKANDLFQNLFSGLCRCFLIKI